MRGDDGRQVDEDSTSDIRWTITMRAVMSPLAVLWIDDDTSILKYAASLLARNGFEIMVAATGSMGLACARKHRFDLVVLDLELPDLAGLEVLRQIQPRDTRTPVVILTAFPGEESAFEAGYLGAARYLRKPLVGGALINALRSAIMDTGRTTPATTPRSKWTSPRGVLEAALTLLQRVATERHTNPVGSQEALDNLIAHFVDGDIGHGSMALPQFAALARIIRLLIESPNCADPVLRRASQLIDRAIGCDLAGLDPRLSEVLDRFADSITLQEEELAKAFGVHASTLGRILRTSFGFGYRELRWAALVRPSIRPLARTLEPIKNVAALCGYDSHDRLCQFVRDFEHVLGVTPSAFRRLARRVRPRPPIQLI
jgi:CheY-like chemotaxis protein/AraC-like DNA-binding protein